MADEHLSKDDLMAQFRAAFDTAYDSGFIRGLQVAAAEASKWSEETLADKLRALAAQAAAPKPPPDSSASAPPEGRHG